MNPKCTTGFVNTCDNTCRTCQHLYLHLKSIQKILFLCLCCLAFKCKHENWFQILSYTSKWSGGIPLLIFDRISHRCSVKNPKKQAWNSFSNSFGIGITYWIGVFLTNCHFSLHLGYVDHQFYFFSESKYVYSNRKNH